LDIDVIIKNYKVYWVYEIKNNCTIECSTHKKIKIITMIQAYFLKSLISNHNQLLIVLSAEPDLIDARSDPHLYF